MTQSSVEGDSDRVENRTNLLLSLAVVGGIAAVAYADRVVVTISLAYLYILPLALSALVHRLRTSLVLALFCMLLHDMFGPFQDVGWLHAARNLLTLGGFFSVVLFVNQLNSKRNELAELVRRQRDELEQEIRLAAEVQQRLLPKRSLQIAGFDIAGLMYPAKTVGGDYFDYIKLPGGDLGLAIADVSGKGVAAALLMPTVQMALRMDAPSLSQTDEIARALNRSVYHVTDDWRYITLFYSKLRVKDQRLQYTNAGHLPPLLLRDTSREPEWLETGGTVMGLEPDVEYTSESIELRPGDLLVLYTDGVVEAACAHGEEYSRRRLVELVTCNRGSGAQELVERIYEDVVTFQGSKILRDDLTVIVLKVLR